VVRGHAVKRAIPGGTTVGRVAGRRVDCVGGIVLDGDGRLLLVLRGRAPSAGTWSIPGGRVEAGESDPEATAREVLEETGVRVEVGPLAGEVERDGLSGDVYVIRDYLCRPVSGIDTSPVRAGDDAADAAWFTPEEMRALETAPGLVAALVEWGVL
jgi:ADP-ribose pyrophosphatase YjhB (NUDIX family)